MRERFNRFVSRGDPYECWLWSGARSGDYGMFYLNGRPIQAHRVALSLSLGRELTEEECALHSCPNGDNKLCCNPSHLRPGTQAENMRDAVERRQVRRGEAVTTGKLTEDGVIAAMARMLSGELQSSIAADLGVTTKAVGDVWRGRSWRWLFRDAVSCRV